MVVTAQFRRFAPRAFITLACCFGVTGCINLDDVTQLSKLADSAQRSLPAVVADIPASCARQNALLNDIPSSERPPELTAQDCSAYQNVADHVTKDQNVLIAYFDALAKLASNTPPAYDQTIDTNVSTIGKLPTLGKDAKAASEAAQSLMKLLADEATAHYRQKEIYSLVEKANPAVQQLTSDLKAVIITDYAGLLSNELQVLDLYYKSPMAAAKPDQRLSLVLVQRQYDNDELTLEARQASAITYGKAMDSLAELHTKLLSEGHAKASWKTVAKDVGPDIANFKAATSQLQTELK
jgi:hypothetical protein